MAATLPAGPGCAPAATALIAEDEPLLAAALQAELALSWPSLRLSFGYPCSRVHPPGVGGYRI